jgi:cytochrome c553
MKRAVMALVLAAPLLAQAENARQDLFTKGSADAGSAKAAACAACHGQGGASTNPEWPKLAAQGSRYIDEQLGLFRDGTRKNPIMQAQAAALSDDDMANLAAYFAAQPANPGVASKDAIALAEPLYRGGDAARGLPACSGCHGPGGAGNPAAAYPRVGGQHAKYVSAQLQAYRAGERVGANAAIMQAVARQLSDQEIGALASYVNGLQ